MENRGDFRDQHWTKQETGMRLEVMVHENAAQTSGWRFQTFGTNVPETCLAWVLKRRREWAWGTCYLTPAFRAQGWTWV